MHVTRTHRFRYVASAVAAALVVALAISLPGAPPQPASAAVPTPTGNDAVITVKVGGDRTGTAAVGGLAGVQLGLYTAQTGGSLADASWGVCTSDADGDCNFTVPNTARNSGNTACATGATGANCDRRFWVRQIGAPSGWTLNPALRTGSNDGTGSEATAYAFQTGTQLRAGGTYSSGNQFMLGTGSTTRNASGGIWQQSRVNPALPERCGLNIALILDLSLSIGTGATLTALKAAADTFTDALTGTPSRMALFSFSNVSPSRYDQPNNPDLLPVSTTAGAAAFKAQYANWTSTGATNWDNGMFVASLAASFPGTTNHYDAAIVLTDGNPTAYGNVVNPSPGTPNGTGEGSQTYNRLREIENGIFSANALKSHATRVLAVGVGPGSGGAQTALNLQAISGGVAFTPASPNPQTADYYQLSDYAVAGQALRDLVFANCTPSLSVVKQIVPSTNTGEDITGAVPAGPGWVFDGDSIDGNVTGLDTTLTTTDDGTGAVNFPLDFTGGVAQAGIGIHEEQQDGYTIVTQGGFNAVCTEKSQEFPDGRTISVTNDLPDSEHPGFVFTMQPETSVSCVIYNRPPSPVADLTVFKSWVINGVPTAQGSQPTEIGATLMRQDPGEEEPVNAGWGVTRGGYAAGDTVSLAEGVFFGQPLCTLDSSIVTEVNGSPPAVADFASVTNAFPTAEETDYEVTLLEGSNTVSVVNTVTCQSELILHKIVQGGDADPELWDLDAFGPDGALDGPHGTDGVRAFVTPTTTYQLAETADPVADPETALYVQVDVRSPDFQGNPRSTGSWYCTLVGPDGISPVSGTIDGLNGGATVPLGARMACTAINQTATMHLRKLVDNTNGGAAVPSDWSLTATPIGPLPLPAGVLPITVTGSDAELGASFNVRPGIQYDLTESEPPDSPPGYQLTDLSCELLDPAPRMIETLNPLDADLCTFTNVYAASILTLEKEVVNEHGGTAAATDWTLSADGPTTGITGATGSEAVTGVLVEPGDYALSETGPAGYTGADWSCDGGTLSGATVSIGVGEDVTCRIVNSDDPPRWTVSKSSDPASGSEVEPGTTITYTLTAADLGGGFAPPSGLTIVDDLSEVLNHASFLDGSITASQGTATLSGTTLTWSIPVLDVSATLQYRVQIANDAHGVTVRNVVTADGSEPCVEPPADGPVREVAPTPEPQAGSVPSADGVVSSVAAVGTIVRLAAADEELPAHCLTTTHRTPGVPLAVTGFAAGALGGLGLLALLAGGLAVLIARRREA